MDKSIRPPPRKERLTTSIPYTKEAFERDLERVQEAWDDSQADRRRDAIYGYLKAVYDLVDWWSAERCEANAHVMPCVRVGCYLCHVKTSTPR